ncbi:trypsin-like peptidase domain-containing protein, partial [Streptomyces sp. CC53]|uniref:trypsin-like peptidase domain-containing protein n=2 Tax=unclassified Streptomyces TaxID=2593676 RepID=UPI00115FF857
MPHTDRTSLVRLCDQTGRPRGTGFVADDLGTVVTGHETVDGLERVVVDVPGGPVHTAELPAITALPAQALALVRTEGLGVPPLPITTRATPAPGSYVRIHAHGWREARVLGTACAAYQATDHDHTVDGALELAIGTDGSEALRRCGAAGGPVVDAETGAVIAVLGATLHTDHRAPGLAVPLVAAAARDPHGPLAALLRRNAACAPAHGADLNLAGVVQLCAATVPPPDPRTVPRPRLARELDRFARGAGQAAAVVCAVVGPPGSGRTTELTALAARRAPAPTLHLRGTDLEPGDTSLADAVGRALRQTARTLGASHGERGAPPGNAADCLEDALPERAARVARAADRPLVVLLDGADLLPAALAHRLPLWTARSLGWLRTHGVRLVLSCGPEFWETTGPLCPVGTLHRPDEPAERLPDAVPTGELTAREAVTARERYGLAEASVAAECARHPLALRQLADVRAALPGALPGAPGRAEIFAAHTDLLCLRAARRIAAGERVRDAATVRRLALGVAGQVHLAARRCLAAANGSLDRESFDALFPRSAGWAAAVLAEGLLVPAGPGYRFGHEEIADWLQAAHVDLDTALDALVHAPTAAVLPQDPPPALSPAPDPAVPVQRARRGPDAGAGTGSDAPVRGDGHRPGYDVHRPPAAAGGADGQHVPGARVPDPTATGVQGPGPRLPGPPAPFASEPPWSGPYASGPPARSPHTPRPGGYEAVVGGQRAPAPVGPPAHADGVPEPYAGAAGAYGTAFPGGGSPPGTGGADGPGARPGRRTASHGVATGATDRPELRTDDTDSTAHVPPRCVGVVVQALLREESTRGAAVLARRLGRLVDAAWADTGPRPAAGRDVAGPGWWAARLLQGTLLRAGDARPYGGVLRQLAGRIATHPAGRPGGPDGCGGTRDFGPWFWERLRLGEDERLELFRRLLPADGPAALHGAARPRYLEAVGRRLAADPRGVQPLLCRWFTDERTLRAEPGTTVPPTVAGVAQALLYTHRDLALDDLCEALVATAHPRAAELLARLTRDEPSALCRAVDRWAHDDDRPARR